MGRISEERKFAKKQEEIRMKIKRNPWKRVGRGALLGAALAAICLMGAAKYRQQVLVEHLQ